jgi:four helix bundle protein
MSESIIKKKSFELAVRGVNLYKYLIAEKKEFVISKQFLRSVTSIGANVREAVNAQSKADLFINYLFLKKNVMKVCIGWSS